ncbi:hypothetical protein BSP36_159 [Bacillus phage BSP36]|uniref:Uncharacterized protein n=1 Tax=Bacillus phage BSP38 TaxID=2283013 RepID=A0A345MK23_BPBSP|nr:hypothetical protein HWB82_gp155 [Bacillus phage BSP38]AXH71205.1 hypothetical protein BSP38_163 [Bacillus phage BSP38]AYJ75246.1 hypothetical protein BSP36_159 [Bacillus phage BSP36]
MTHEIRERYKTVKMVERLQQMLNQEGINPLMATCIKKRVEKLTLSLEEEF